MTHGLAGKANCEKHFSGPEIPCAAYHKQHCYPTAYQPAGYDQACSCHPALLVTTKIVPRHPTAGIRVRQELQMGSKKQLPTSQQGTQDRMMIRNKEMPT